MSEPCRPIAQADPGAGYLASKRQIDEAVARVLASGSYILGPECGAFEAEFSAFVGAPFALGCGSGTDALVLALKALGIGPGDSVATVSHTAVATVAAIELAGAEPVLLDVEADTYTLDPEELETVLARPAQGGPPIRAVIPVHLYGQPATIDTICELAARRGVPVIEDCAQAHGAAFRGRQVGRWGTAAAFSFYPTKNLGALGDAGAVVVADEALAGRVKALRQYGWGEDRISARTGGNSRLDELQAAVLRVKLARLDADNARRQAIASAYDRALGHWATGVPSRRPDRTHVFHQYVLRRPDRDDFCRQLQEQGVGTAIHYPVPVHLQPAYRGRVRLGPRRCSRTERLATEILSLPMHPHLTKEQTNQVSQALDRHKGE